MIPDPTTADSNNAVPAASAVTRRPKVTSNNPTRNRPTAYSRG
jgi:hypothetical protein